MSKSWKILVVLALGLTVDVPGPETGPGWQLQFDGPLLALLIYGALTVITLIKTLNHLPGVFALRSPLGVVKSGYEYLWTPAILSAVLGFTYTGMLADREPGTQTWTLLYGSARESYLTLAALGLFAVLMWSLKLRASMIQANSRLEQGEAFS